MFTGIYQSAIILATAVVYYVIDVALMRRFDPLRVKGSSRAWDYTAMAVGAGIVLVLQPIVLPWLALYTDAWWGIVIQLVGVIMVTGGLALTWWARFNLGQFFGERVEYQDGQYLIETGPYAYIRHPIYTSFFLMTIGLFLTNPSALNILIVIYAFMDFGRIAPGEEVFLAEKIPGYADYIKRTGRFLPKLWRTGK